MIIACPCRHWPPGQPALSTHVAPSLVLPTQVVPRYPDDPRVDGRGRAGQVSKERLDRCGAIEVDRAVTTRKRTRVSRSSTPAPSVRRTDPREPAVACAAPPLHRTDGVQNREDTRRAYLTRLRRLSSDGAPLEGTMDLTTDLIPRQRLGSPLVQMPVMGSAAQSPSASGLRPKLSSMVRRTL